MTTEPLRVSVTGSGTKRMVMLPDATASVIVHQAYAETTVCRLLERYSFDTNAPLDFLNARGEVYLSVPSVSWVLALGRGRRGIGRRELFDQVLAYDRATRHPIATKLTADFMAVLTADLADMSAEQLWPHLATKSPYRPEFVRGGNPTLIPADPVEYPPGIHGNRLSGGPCSQRIRP